MGEWRTGSLSEIAEIVMGQSPDGESSNTGRSGLPLLNGPTEFGTRSPVPVQYTTDPRKTCKIGDILFCVRGSTTGRMNWADLVYAIGRGIAALRHKSGPEFQYYLRAVLDYNLPTLLQAATGSTFPNVCFSDLDELEIEIPLEYEQRAIASVLSCLDDKIDLLHRQNKTLEAMAETVWRQWILQGKDEKWEEKSLDEIANYLNGLPSQKYPPENPIDRLPVIKIKELKTGFTDMSDWATSEVPTEYVIETGDIIFSWSGSLEIVMWAHGKGVLNQHLFKVSSRTYPKWFYYFATKMFLPEFRAIAESKATTMGHIQRHHLSDAKLAVPSLAALEEYDYIISPLFDKLVKNMLSIRTFTQLRDILLPKLMSGEVRIKGV